MLSRIVLRSEHQVLEDRHVAELVRDLPRLREAEVDNLERREPVDAVLAQPNRAAIGAVKACDDVEEGRLSCPIRTDQARDGLSSDREGAIVHGADATKGLSNPRD